MTTPLLQQSLDRFPDLLFLVNRDGVILDYRGGRAGDLYAPPEAFLGRSLLSVLPPPAATRLWEAVARVSNTHSPEAVDYRLPLAGGERAFEARLVPLLPDAILGVCRDITETPRLIEGGRPHDEVAEGMRPAPARASTLQGDERFRRLAESIDQVLWLRDADARRVLYVSPAFELIFGRSTEELYRNPAVWMESIHPDDRPWAMASYEGWTSGRTRPLGSLAYRVVRPDGSIRSVIDNVTVFSDHHFGRAREVGGVLRDVTAQRGVLDEFNQALSILIGNAQIAQRLGPDDVSVRESLDQVLAASRTLEKLVRRMVAAEPAWGPPESNALAIAGLALDGWRLVIRTRSNALIEGNTAATETVLQLLRSHCLQPAVEWHDAHVDTRPATLIVRQVDNLSALEQRHLLQLIEDGGRTQVLSTSSRPLYPLVEKGLFLDHLYYRLNVLRLDV